MKLVNRKKMEELMETSGLKEMLDRMAKANGVKSIESANRIKVSKI